MLGLIKRFRSALAPDLNRSDLFSLSQELDPANSFKVRAAALRKIMDWMRLPTKISADHGIPEHIHSRNVRFNYLFQFLERHPKEAGYVAENIRLLLRRGSSVRLYCMTGISENSGFFSELSDRIVQRFLPNVYVEKDVSDIFKIIFTDEKDSEWLGSSYKMIFEVLLKFMEKHDISMTAAAEDQQEALVILGSQVAALGTSREIRSKLGKRDFVESNFLKLNMMLNRRELNTALILQTADSCRKELGDVKNEIERSGVSVSLIYSIERMSALLDRIEMIIYLRETTAPDYRRIIVSQFLIHLIHDEHKTRLVGDFLYENLHMLTRKIVECAGEKGGHIIASTKIERRILWNAAAWAGVLTAFTALIKTWIGMGKFPPLIEGFFFFINYAIGFLLMQKWHLALSSKQPAYMASALSKKFEVFKDTENLSDVTTEVRHITYSQIIATIGNLAWVIPLVIALDWIWFYFTGSHVVHENYAHKIIRSHDLTTSMTLFYSILTGVLLFMSSAIAGWVENWMAFRKIPQLLLESSFLNSFFGKSKLKEFSQHAASTIGGMAGNISIAFLLSLPIVIERVTGIPLDIRHVTLATGTITLAFNSLNWDPSLWPQMISMVLSILIIGVCNFGVSFYLALKMAAIARNVASKHIKTVFKNSFFRS